MAPAAVGRQSSTFSSESERKRMSAGERVSERTERHWRRVTRCSCPRLVGRRVIVICAHKSLSHAAGASFTRSVRAGFLSARRPKRTTAAPTPTAPANPKCAAPSLRLKTAVGELQLVHSPAHSLARVRGRPSASCRSRLAKSAWLPPALEGLRRPRRLWARHISDARSQAAKPPAAAAALSRTATGEGMQGDGATHSSPLAQAAALAQEATTPAANHIHRLVFTPTTPNGARLRHSSAVSSVRDNRPKSAPCRRASFAFERGRQSSSAPSLLAAERTVERLLQIGRNRPAQQVRASGRSRQPLGGRRRKRRRTSKKFP